MPPRRLPPARDALEEHEIVEGRRQIGVVDRRVEAAGDLGNEVVGHTVEDLIHAIVIRLPAGAVRLDEPDAVEDEREVALDVCVDAEEQIAVRGNGTISCRVERDSPRRRDRSSPFRRPGVVGGEVVAREEDVLVIHEGCVVEERGRFDGPSVLLGHAQVGQGEDRVVVTR